MRMPRTRRKQAIFSRMQKKLRGFYGETPWQDNISVFPQQSNLYDGFSYLKHRNVGSGRNSASGGNSRNNTNVESSTQQLTYLNIIYVAFSAQYNSTALTIGFTVPRHTFSRKFINNWGCFLLESMGSCYVALKIEQFRICFSAYHYLVA